MAEETKTTETEVKPDLAVDPFVLKLLQSTGRTVEQILEPSTDDKKLETPDLEAQLKADVAAKEAKDKAEAEAKAKAEADAKVETDRKAEADRKAANDAATMRPVVLQKKEVAAKPDLNQEAQQAQQAEDAYIAELTPEQQDEIELARFAEASGKKPGQAKKVIEYYRKLDKFIEDNPDLTPESESYLKFKEDHEPALTPLERRRLEREMISTQAVTKATAEARKEFEPVVRELNEIKVAPLVTGVLNDVEAVMSRKPEGEELTIDSETFKKVRSLPYDKALEEFPVEAPIVVGTVAAAQEWTRIWNGTVEISPDNPTHNWIMNFIAAQERKMAERPATETVRDGRQFLPLSKFIQLQNTNPALASKYYSFDQAAVVDLISRNGVEQYNLQVKKLERSGFTRTVSGKKSAATEVPDKKTETATGSPKATAHASAGAGEADRKAAPGDLPAHLRGVFSSAQSLK